MSQLWRTWVYDSTSLPIRWEPHPHSVFKILARIAAGIVGSFIPFGLILIRSGVLSRLDDGTMVVGWMFWIVAAVFVSTWLATIIVAVESEERSLTKYVLLSTAPPANLIVLFYLIQP